MSERVSERRTDLDWLRIAAFGTLILYHVGMFYVTWDWHVKSPHQSHAIEPLMLLVNPWRLTLLFIISGAATRFMADKMSAGKLFGSRMWRLFPPLILAMFVIVPPQSYYEILDAMRLGQLATDPRWLDNFYVKYVTASGHWCDAEGCLITPTYNHMWFVAYLIAYTLLLFPLLPLLRRAPKALGVLIAGPGLLITPWLFLFAMRVTLFPIYGETHAIWEDPYVHATSFAAFLLGFAIAKHDCFFAACERQRYLALGLALAAFAFLIWARATYAAGTREPPAWGPALATGIRELQAWGGIVACFGFAHRHLANADSPLRRYLTDAIFPFYIVHQTAIVVFAYNLARLDWPLWIEAPTLIALTILACWATYELVRRVPLLRPWFGLRSEKRGFRATDIEAATIGGHLNAGRSDAS